MSLVASGRSFAFRDALNGFRERFLARLAPEAPLGDLEDDKLSPDGRVLHPDLSSVVDAARRRGAFRAVFLVTWFFGDQVALQALPCVASCKLEFR